jgi:hypothetical protein
MGRKMMSNEILITGVAIIGTACMWISYLRNHQMMGYPLFVVGFALTIIALVASVFVSGMEG